MRKEEIIRAIEVLEEEGYLEFGSIIPRKKMEKFIGMESSEEWVFKGPLLAFLMHLTDMGYLCTTSGVENGCIKIYDVDEVAYQSNKTFEQSLRRMGRVKNCLTNMNKDDFNEKEARKLMHVTNKIVAGLRAIKSTLNDI